MRTLMTSLLVTVLAFGLVFAAAPVDAQDDVTLVCSAPVDGATLGVVPTAVTLTLSAEVEDAAATVTDADDLALEDVEVAVDGAVVTVTAPFAAGATYTVAVEGTEVAISFTVAENALAVEDAELVDDCPVAEEPVVEATEEATEEPVVEATEEATEEPVVEATEEATEEPVVEATEEATEEPVVEATEEATEEPVVEATEEATEEPVVEATEEATEEPVVLLSEEVYEGSAGTTNFTVNLPAEYIAQENDTFFLFPVVVMAETEDTVTNYLSIPDRVNDYVVIYTTFTSADLETFGLEAGASIEDVVGALIRSDSEIVDESTVEIAGAPAVRVAFTNSTSEKDGIFYVVAFADGEDTNYLLIQGSAESEDWPQFEAGFEALVESIAVAE